MNLRFYVSGGRVCAEALKPCVLSAYARTYHLQPLDTISFGKGEGSPEIDVFDGALERANDGLEALQREIVERDSRIAELSQMLLRVNQSRESQVSVWIDSMDPDDV